MELEAAIAQYGYWAIFLGAVIEGETALILGAVAAGAGMLSAPLVALVAWLGGCFGDFCFYMLGLKGGARLLARLPKLSDRSKKFRSLVKRRATFIVLISRFAYGLRSVIPMACAASGVSPQKFIGLNLVSGLAWSLFYSLLGEGLGLWLADYFSRPAKLWSFVILLAAVLALGAWWARRRTRAWARAQKNQAE